jgi:hypothetical protein
MRWSAWQLEAEDGPHSCLHLLTDPGLRRPGVLPGHRLVQFQAPVRLLGYGDTAVLDGGRAGDEGAPEGDILTMRLERHEFRGGGAQVRGGYRAQLAGNALRGKANHRPGTGDPLLQPQQRVPLLLRNTRSAPWSGGSAPVPSSLTGIPSPARIGTGCTRNGINPVT